MTSVQLSVRPIEAPVSTVVTPEQLREVLENISFSDDQVTAVRALAPNILSSTRGAAAAVIADCISFSSEQAEAIAALNGQSVPAAPARQPIANPRFADRFAGAIQGALDPILRWPTYGCAALLATIVGEAFDLPLAAIPYVNVIAQATHAAGFAGDLVTALTVIAGAGATASAVRGFARPTE